MLALEVDVARSEGDLVEIKASFAQVRVVFVTGTSVP